MTELRIVSGHCYRTQSCERLASWATIAICLFGDMFVYGRDIPGIGVMNSGIQLDMSGHWREPQPKAHCNAIF